MRLSWPDSALWAKRTGFATATTVYHGMPANILKAQFTPGHYLAFLGRITPEKGPETAIRVAQSVRMPLKIAERCRAPGTGTLGTNRANADR